MAAAVLVTILVGCSSSAKIVLASGAVAKFHQRLNRQAFAAIYNDTDHAFRENTTQIDFTQTLEQVHRKLGLLRSDKLSGAYISYTINGASVRVIARDEFENGPATEQFLWTFSGDAALLNFYSISSDALR